MIRRRQLTPEEIAQRNIARNRQRIMNPPKRTLWDRVQCVPVRVRSWWWDRKHPKVGRLLARAQLDFAAMREHRHATGLPEHRYPEHPYDDCGGPA